jgi:hypothetical protein
MEEDNIRKGRRGGCRGLERSEKELWFKVKKKEEDDV